MKSAISLTTSIVVSALCLLTVQLGCGGGPNLHDVYSTNIKKLHACYMMYMEDHNFQGPEDEAEFKEFLKNDPTAIYLIKKIDLTPELVDGIFISDRDGQPFEVRYGLRGEADHAIVFEKTGVDGKRLVALTKPTEFGKQDYEDHLSGKIKPETAAGAGARSFDEEESDDGSANVDDDE